MKALVAAAVVVMLAIGCCLGGIGFTQFIGLVASAQEQCGAGVDNQPAVGSQAEEAIPKRILELYLTMGQRYGLSWAVLAGIGYVESRHGRNPGVSSAGARGPMQFMSATWKSYGVDGDGDGDRDIMDPADAIASAAHYLRASGAPQNWVKAIWAYNQSHPYYNSVMAMARKYAAGDFDVDQPAADLDCVGAIGPASELGARIATLARAEAANPQHNRESGGDNCNYYTTALRLTGERRYTCSNGWKHEAWCADFAKWVWMHAGASTAGATPAADSFRTSYGQRHGTWHTGNPQPGDAIVFSFGHVGLVTKVTASEVSYVSGNTTNRATGRTDAVLEKTVSRSWGPIMGYATPIPASRRDP